jgi:hypothetical protein
VSILCAGVISSGICGRACRALDLPANIARSGNAQAIAGWKNAWRSASAERAKFEPALSHILERRADLKALQVSSRSNRQALNDKAALSRNL